ncbi:PP2C family protein-serine/threonine phosphatase [Paraburkholderia humisilvae]|uniref:Serine/threonine phosphatase stp n=1 Tax=Paraburkholderia humisilvae TaxID=627669 RepID=A0A6J5DCK7_9BURK|nr:PP2C family serine/threonine-protein phosphatase [Paraburkholderia humisilvae]CAB3751164.1 Serine/threonine phosphatase stp [Paraburkholderia humisilvae]
MSSTKDAHDPSTRCVSAGRTETGKVRHRNEDAILVRDDLGLWAVADGVGGHAAGDYASALIVERLGALRRDGTVYDFIEAIEDTLQQVNGELRELALARQVDVIASTAVILVHDREFVLCGWVGDSRGYVYEAGSLRQLTRDHVHGPKPDVTQFGASAHSQTGAGVLTRAIGAEDRLYLDWAVAGSRAGMQFLLCSDGINKELSDAELELAYRDTDVGPHERLTRLFTQALARAARDNLSAVIVRLDEP